MRAAVLVAPRQLVLQDVPVPKLKPGEVLIRMHANSVCGSDVHAYRGTHARAQPGGWFGHELAGAVEQLGAGVAGLEIGQRAAVDGVIPCGACLYCQEGHGNRCLNYLTTGFRGDGGLAEFVRVPAGNVYPIPDNVTMDQAALIQPLSIAYHAVHRRAEVQAGETIVIMGAGPIGLCCLALCRAQGARAIVSDLRDGRLRMAERLGAAAAVDIREQGLLEVVKGQTDSVGANRVIECVGGEQEETLLEACKLTRRGGVIVVVGLFSSPSMPLGSLDFATRELTVKASQSYVGAQTYAACVDLVASGAIDLTPLVTHTFPLAGAPEALRRLDAGDQQIVKAVIHPNE
ncbi:MAG: alcohol dehydrogenase catalytic domain-containing protein [Chloroflexi bacterium]|nr:alcohol dehydrogenase catalytic domain-containing protein [Chloroflexota bacterium]